MNSGDRYVLVIAELQYDSKKPRSIVNDIREAFMGIVPPKYPEGRGSPNISKKIRDMCKIDKDIIDPIHFSLIKKPEKIVNAEGRTYTIRNTAVGAMILYEYLGLAKDLRRFLNIFDEYLKRLIESKKPQFFSYITNYDIIIGNKINDISVTENI